MQILIWAATFGSLNLHNLYMSDLLKLLKINQETPKTN